jgi:hypothetical protein
LKLGTDLGLFVRGVESEFAGSVSVSAMEKNKKKKTQQFDPSHALRKHFVYTKLFAEQIALRREATRFGRMAKRARVLLDEKAKAKKGKGGGEEKYKGKREGRKIETGEKSRAWENAQEGEAVTFGCLPTVVS